MNDSLSFCVVIVFDEEYVCLNVSQSHDCMLMALKGAILSTVITSSIEIDG
jgi:hypothetical protein